MSTIAEFVSRTHTRGANMPRRQIGIKDAQTIAENLNWSRMSELAAEAEKYLPQVLAEIETLRAALAAHPERMQERAFWFGIATPNRDEAQSIGWALGIDGYQWLSPAAMAGKEYRSLVTGKTARMGLREQLASTIFHARLRESWTDLAVDKLEALPGVGPKVARMIHAVANPDAKVFTVDLWHMRQLLWASGQDYVVKAATGGKAYAILEQLWLNYAVGYFPGVPTWAVQWATWCAADGRFVSHSALWADLAEGSN
jgi:hypothetical protein